MQQFLRETLLSQKAFSRGLFNPASVKNIIEHHVDNKTDHAHRLWSLLMLELWFQRFID
jgi:asparagine synthase (glutamine-hydrolysing)